MAWMSATRKPATPKDNQQEKTISLNIRHAPFRKVLFCNKFQIIKLGSHRLFSFGLQTENGDVLDSYHVVVTGEDIENLRSSWLDYLGKLGLPELEIRDFTEWRQRFSDTQTVETSNFIRLGRVGKIAEFRFFNFPVSRILDYSGFGDLSDGVETTPMALIRCDLDLQIHFLMTVFDDAVEV